MKIAKKIIDNLKYHVVDSTVMLAESNPIYSAFEVGIAGMSNETSIHARLVAAALAYAGLGRAYSKGRDMWRGIFRITDKTSEKAQTLCDTAYTAAFNLALSPPMYFACGARDLKEIAVGTACAVGFGALNGAPMGYAIDVFRDLSGLQTNERNSYPDLIRKQTPMVKKGIAAVLIAASIGGMGLIYSAKSDNHQNLNAPIPSVQQTKSNFNANSLEERLR